MLDDLKFDDIELNIDFEYTTKDDEEKEGPVKKQILEVLCLERKNKNVYRRAFSELQLVNLELDFKEGYSYNFITGGDIDGLSYLSLMLRYQELDYCLFSTWCMAMDDILQIEEWLESGKIKKIDAYVGEIFPGSYKREHIELKRIMKKYDGKLVVFRNHSKIFAGYGDKFHFGIQTSANINTNPRTENGCITIGKEIYDFYKDFFDGIISIAK